MQVHQTADNRFRSRQSRRRPFVFAALALVLLLAGFTLFVQYLKASPGFVTLSARRVGGAPSIVFVSGDIGLGRLSVGGRVARRLGQAGYPVVGLDSLAAFSQRRTPDQAADIVARAMAKALARHPGAPIVLVGESFGSDILILALQRLPRALVDRVDGIVLIVPPTDAYLQVSAGEILGVSRPDANLVPLAGGLPDIPVTCVYGAEETHSLCPLLRGPDVQRIALPGGHLLRLDSDRVFAVVLEAIRSAAVTPA